MAKCIDDLIKAGAGAITRKEAEAIIAEVERRFGARFPKTKGNPFQRPPRPSTGKTGKGIESTYEGGTKSRETLMQEAALEAFQERVQAKQEKLRRQELQVEKQVIRATQLARLGGDIAAVESLLVDAKGELTLQGRIRAIRENYLGDLTGALETLAKDPEWKAMDPVEREVLLAEALMDKEMVTRKSAATGNRQWSAVDELAYTFRVMDDDAFKRKNEAGADIKYTPGHVPQSWNPSAVRLFGLSAKDKARLPFSGSATRKALLTKAQARWVEFVLPRVDRSRYLDPETGGELTDEQLRETLSAIWRTIASNGLTGEPSLGEASLASQLGAHRELWFVDARGFVEANREFGARDLFSAITGEAVRHAREIALLEIYGPNPTMGFKTDLAQAMGRQAEDAPGAGRKGSYRAQIIFDELSGKGLGAPEDKLALDSLAKYDMVSRAFKGLRNLIASAKLGMLPFSQMNDMATFRLMAVADGLGTGKTIRAYLAQYNPLSAADRKAARRHGILAQTIIGDAALRFGGDTGTGEGWTSKFANATVKYSGAQYMTNAGKTAFQVSIGWHLADARGLAFEQLPGKFGEMVRRYGITGEEWEIIRKSQTVDLFGEETITPHTVARYVPRDMTPEAYNRVREAALKVGAMMSEEADIAILQPGAKEKAIASGGSFEGTIAGELMRSVFFFKTFTVAMVTKAWPRIAEARGPGWGRAGAVTEFLLANMIAGAITIQLKEIAKGRNPREMDPGFWAAAFMQAGGLGIFGDFVFGDANRFGGGFLETLGGPVAGMIGDAQRLTVGNAQDVIEGKDPKLAADAIQFGKNYAPLMNLWYTRLALDHLLFYHLQEAANPGYLRRVRQRVEREGQSWWWDPNDTAPEEAPDLAEAFGGA